FSLRSGIVVNLTAPATMARLPRDLELALFRVVQECLTNIQRHSGSNGARILLTRTAANVVLRVSDRGHGMEAKQVYPNEIAMAGVGIAGMRLRLRQLGGGLQIRSTRHGTTVIATVPTIKESDHDPDPRGGRP